MKTSPPGAASGNPQGYARLLMNRGRIQVNGRSERAPEAQANFHRSLEQYRRVVGTQSAEVAEVLGDLSETFMWVDNSCGGRTALLVKQSRSSRRPFRQYIPDRCQDRISPRGSTVHLLNQQDEAAAILLDALTKNTQLLGPPVRKSPISSADWRLLGSRKDGLLNRNRWHDKP